VCASKRESRGSVIEGCACPVGRAVTGLTSRRETSLHVTRIVRAVVIGLMALNARRRIGQVVCPARTERGVVALRTLQRDVSAIQGKAGGRMVEGSSTPTRGGVALLARGREIRLHVVGAGGSVEISLVAGHTRRRSGQVICAARAEGRVVALGALQRGMRSVQSEAGARMVEGCACPVRRAVALLARSGESRLHVVRAGRSVEIGLVALNAPSGSGQVICATGAERRVVALGALQRDMGAIQSEAGARMVEGCTGPVRRAVALLARSGESRLHVVRACRSVEIRLMALNARGGIRQVVRAGRAEGRVVALRALQGYVRTRQGETSGGVVERAACPIRRVVALLTCRREARLHVIRIGRAIEIGLVALHALRVVGQIVGPTGAEGRVVALRALQRGVRARQRESSGRVIESGAGPTGRVVALRAVLREAGLYVIRSRGAVEVRLVAGVASRAVRQVVCARRTEGRVVALRALQRHVSAGQRESSGRVIESGTGPAGRVMALRAVLREAGLYVIRVACVIEIRLMASDASRAGQAVGAGRTERRVVTLIALQRHVSAGQREAGRGMVKTGTVPRRGGMALLASCREAGLDMVRSGRAVEILHVARSAISRRSDELSIDVALRASHADVRAGQRELRESVVIESRRIPRGSAVAALASGWEAGLGVRRIVGLIEVRQVTSDASRWRIVELPACVAGGTIQRRVRAGQGEAGELQVIELGAHPVVHRVALLAGDWQT